MQKAIRNKKIGTAVVLVGVLLVIFGAGLTFYNLWDENRAERSVETTLDGILDEMENGTPEAPVLEQDRSTWAIRESLRCWSWHSRC